MLRVSRVSGLVRLVDVEGIEVLEVNVEHVLLEPQCVSEQVETPVVATGASDAVLLAELGQREGHGARTVANSSLNLLVAVALEASDHEGLVLAANGVNHGGEEREGESDSGGVLSSHGFMWSACGSVKES